MMAILRSKRTAAALGVLLLVSGAAAQVVARELPPAVYEQARANAGTVAVLRVTSVQALPPGQTQGSCELQGMIESVERGVAATGQAVTVMIPCIGPGFQPMPGPFPGYQQDALLAAERVRVWMTGGRLVQRGLDLTIDRPA